MTVPAPVGAGIVTVWVSPFGPVNVTTIVFVLTEFGPTFTEMKVLVVVLPFTVAGGAPPPFMTTAVTAGAGALGPLPSPQALKTSAASMAITTP